MPLHVETTQRVIYIQPQAPTKPAFGAACNGCGVCCLAQPCPLGMLLSRRRHGPCLALQWSAQDQRYWCGALAGALVQPAAGPWSSLARIWQAARARLLRRWIAAGVGCDCRLELASSATIEASQPHTDATRHD